MGDRNYGDLESKIGANVEVQIIAAESSGRTLSFSATELPDGLSIDSETGEITGTIDSGAYAYSPYAVTVRATDVADSYYNEIEFDWYVRHLVLRSPGDQANLVDDEVSLEADFAYAGTGTLVFGATGLPSGLSINTATGEIYGTIDSNADDEEPYEVTVSVTDGTHYAEKTFEWVVGKLLADELLDQWNWDGQVAVLDLAAGIRSIPGHTISYSVVGLPTGTYSIDAGELTWNIPLDAHENGPFEVTITITDEDAEVSLERSLDWAVTTFNSLVQAPPPYVPLMPTEMVTGGIAGRLPYLRREIAHIEGHMLLATAASPQPKWRWKRASASEMMVY